MFVCRSAGAKSTLNRIFRQRREGNLWLWPAAGMLDPAGAIEAERYPDQRGFPMPVDQRYALRIGPDQRARRRRGEFSAASISECCHVRSVWRGSRIRIRIRVRTSRLRHIARMAACWLRQASSQSMARPMGSTSCRRKVMSFQRFRLRCGKPQAGRSAPPVLNFSKSITLPLASCSRWRIRDKFAKLASPGWCGQANVCKPRLATTGSECRSIASTKLATTTISSSRHH